MNALLLAAGLGTRLRPLTNSVPKCLVTIGDIPLLDVWLHELARMGFVNFLINTHHLAEVVKEHMATHPLRDMVQLTHEKKLLGTGGTIRANRYFFQHGTTLIAHADNLCICNLKRFIDAHFKRPSGTMITMMTFRTPKPECCGIVQLDRDGIVQHFFEKHPHPPGNLANAAIYLVEPEVVEIMTASDPPINDISTELLPRLLGKINTWHCEEGVIDIGTPESLQEANFRFTSVVRSLSASWMPPRAGIPFDPMGQQ